MLRRRWSSRHHRCMKAYSVDLRISSSRPFSQGRFSEVPSPLTSQTKQALRGKQGYSSLMNRLPNFAASLGEPATGLLVCHCEGAVAALLVHHWASSVAGLLLRACPKGSGVDQVVQKD